MVVGTEALQRFNIKKMSEGGWTGLGLRWLGAKGGREAGGKNDTQGSWVGCVGRVSGLTDTRGTGGGSGLGGGNSEL